MKYQIYRSLYRSTAKYEAQSHLTGRTHYVDDDTLRFHHARVLQGDIAHNGLTYWLIESVALDYKNTSRGYRYVIFDIFGNVVSRVDLDNTFKSSKQALKACKEFLSNFDALKHTKEESKRQEKYDRQSWADLTEELKRISA